MYCRVSLHQDWQRCLRRICQPSVFFVKAMQDIRFRLSALSPEDFLLRINQFPKSFECSEF